MRSKSKIMTGFLLGITFFLIGAIFYISFLLTSGKGNKSNVAPRKTKAADITYKEVIDLLPTSSASDDTVPTSAPTNPTNIILPVTDTPVPTNSNSPVPFVPTDTPQAPTPTKVILAYQNPTATSVVTSFVDEPETSPSTQLTKASTLPQSGFINNALIVFTVSGLLIFFSFLF